MTTVADATAARLAKARRLIVTHSYLVTPGSVYVYAEEPGVAGYSVEDGQCPCPDSRIGWASKHLDGRCKHVILAEIVRSAVRSMAEARLSDIATEFGMDW